MSEETLGSDSSSDVAVEGGGEVGKIMRLINEQNSKPRRNYLAQNEVEEGVERVFTFLEACLKVGYGNDESELELLKSYLIDLVLTKMPFTDFRNADREDGNLSNKVNDALRQMEESAERDCRSTESRLDHVVPPSQWPHSTKPVESEDAAATQVREFVAHALLSRDGSIEDIGEPEHFIAHNREGWKVPVTLRSEDGQEHQGEITIYSDGAIAQVTRGMLKKAFGMAA